jgi:macrolide transport system ATP-binding/permease protein
MPLFVKVRSFLKTLFLFRRVEADLDQEVQSHLEMLTEENVRAGMPPEEAQRAARIELGGVEQVKEQVREIRIGNWFHSVISDCRYGLRQLRKNPGFATAAVLTLALGIGANTAVFSLVNSALFKPLYAANPGELVSIFWGDTEGHGLSNHSYADYLDYSKESAPVLSGLAAFTTVPANLVLGKGTERVNVGLVSDNYFSVLGVRPIVGRGFLPEENSTTGSSFVAVISEDLWRQEFGGTRAFAGKTVWLNNAGYSVIGVVPERASRMAVVAKIDVFVPAMMEGVIGGDPHFLSDRGNKEFMVVGRVRKEATLSQAQAQFNVIAAHLQKQYPETWTEDGHAHPLTMVPATAVPFELRGMVIGFAGLLMGAVGSVLLVACSNVASFLLARATMRRKEISVRLALGASRWRLVQQLVTESSLLALLGGTVGFLVAAWAKNLLSAFAPNIGVPLVIDLSLDYRVLGFSILVTLLTTLAFGLAPALQATRPDVVEGLKEGEQIQTTGLRRTRLRNGLMVTQVAGSLVLLMCAGMFLSSLDKLNSVNLGFNSNNLALLSVDLGMEGYSPERSRAFITQAISRLEGVPGSEAVAVAARVPMGLSRLSDQMLPEGSDVRGEQRPVWVGSNSVGSGYFEAMGIPLLRGRVFTQQDCDGVPRVAVVNDTLASLYWPNQDPVGKRIREPGGKSFEVVGVAKTSKYESIGESPLSFVYLPLNPGYTPALTFHIRTRIPPQHILQTLKGELRALDPRLTIFDVETMNEHLADSMLPIRMGAILLGIFGGLALALTSVGLYGLLSYVVRQQTHEIGIRMALGANPRDVLRLVLRHGISLTVRGIVIGVVFGFGLSILIANQLYGVAPADIVALGIVALMQVGVALLACYIPARRATRVDPMVALRYE